MQDASLRIADAELTEDRFSRFRLLHWWDQDRIRNTNVLVVGAGALGNEILKNLALLGFERVVIVDCDTIELSNLSRTVLYRERDIGRNKAQTAADAFRRLYDRATVIPVAGNILFDVGIGLFSWADVIIAGLDNREARLWINRCAWNVGKPWIDGAIEGLSGVARVFVPGKPPCYECTLGEVDWKLLHRRMSCNLLTRDEMESGKVPTTPTTAAVVAGIQVQEALKYIHGLPVLQGKAFVFDGIQHTSYVVEYTENSECFAHHRYDRIVRLQKRSHEMTLHDLFETARIEMNASRVVVEFSREIIHGLVCPVCSEEEELFTPVGTVDVDRAKCPRDGATRTVSTIHNYTGVEPFGRRKLNNLGLPLWDVYVARADETERAFLIDLDDDSVVGQLSTPRRDSV